MCSTRKHTPIVSKKQEGFFGAELARKEKGQKGKTDMSKAELARHLHEAKGKDLPLYHHSEFLVVDIKQGRPR
ncbi:MAG: hypothetical protein PHY56_00060 [Candidatus Omnitrophica bacterium]|nr:hypothetical protein [Candidatus Omnitrophota bacterium]